MAPTLFRRTTQLQAAASDAVIGWSVERGTVVPLSMKTIGAYGESIQQQIGARKTLRADDDGLALAYASNPIAHRCVDLRAQKVSEMPKRVVLKGTHDPIPDHPLILALDESRRYWRKSLLYLWQSAKCIHGEAYIEKIADQFGRPMTLRWLNPLAIEPYVDGDAIAWFDYQSDTFNQTRIETERVVYDYYHNPLDDYRGLAPMQVALSAVNILNGVMNYQNAFFANDARPGGVLSGDGNVHFNDTTMKRLKNFWDEQLSGARKAFRTIFMPVGLKYSQIQQAPTPEHETVERMAIRKICDAFGVPVPLVDLDEMRFQLSDEQPKQFYENTVIPDCMEIAEVINGELLPFFDPGAEDVVFEFDFDKIRALLDDQVKRATAINSRVLTGVLTVNEARREYGLKEWDGGEAVMLPKASMLVQLDDLPSIEEMTGAQATAPADQATPDPNGGAVPTGDTRQNDSTPAIAKSAPLQTDALGELKAWAEVARKRGVAKALEFTIYHIPPAVADGIRAQLFALGEDAKPVQIKAVYADARRQLTVLFDEAELAGLNERLRTLGLPEAAV